MLICWRHLSRWRHILDRRSGRHIRRRTDPFSQARMLLPHTPPAPSPVLEPWPPRITRWIRLTSPLPDDTILLSPIPAATVLEFMGRGFTWDPSR